MADDGELEEMRCRTCGTLLGYRRRQGPFLFWCSEACAESINAKMERDQVKDEVAVELHLGNYSLPTDDPKYRRPIGMMDISRFTETPYTRVQQILYRRGIDLGRVRA